MFKIVPEPQFTVEVQLSRPAADMPVTVQITWRHKGVKDLVAWQASALDRKDGDAAFLDEVIVDWGRFVDENEKPVPYSKEALAVVLAQFPSAGRELVQAYVKRLQDARAKN